MAIFSVLILLKLSAAFDMVDFFLFPKTFFPLLWLLSCLLWPLLLSDLAGSFSFSLTLKYCHTLSLHL